MNNGKYDQKQTITALNEQVMNYQNMLQLQTKENARNEEFILLLNQEIDSLKLIIEDKQYLINTLEKKISDQEDKLSVLEKQVESNRLDNLALYQLDQQNQQLLSKLQETQKLLEEANIENRFVSEQRHDLLYSNELKIEKMKELEISLPIEISKLQSEVDYFRNRESELTEEVVYLRQENEHLKVYIKWNDELKLDQLARSKQAEYKTLMELDEMNHQVTSLLEEKLALENTNKMYYQRNSELNSQLKSSINSMDQVQNTFGAVIDTLEREQGKTIYKEKLLKKENFILQSENQVLSSLLSRTYNNFQAAATALSSPNYTTSFSSTMPAQQRPWSSSRINPLSKRSPTLTLQSTETANEIKESQSSNILIDESNEFSTNKENSFDRPSTTMSYQSDLPSNNLSTSVRDVMINQLTYNLQDIDSKYDKTLLWRYLSVIQSSLYLWQSIHTYLKEDKNSRDLNDSEIDYEEDEESSPFSKTMISKTNKNNNKNQISKLKKALKKFNLRSLYHLYLHDVRLNDSDITKLVDWLRNISFGALEVIDLSKNHLSGESLIQLIAWISSWSLKEQKDRIAPLAFNLNQNQISSSYLQEAQMIIQSQIDFSYVTIERDDQDKNIAKLFIYGKKVFPYNKDTLMKDGQARQNNLLVMFDISFQILDSHAQLTENERHLRFSSSSANRIQRVESPLTFGLKNKIEVKPSVESIPRDAFMKAYCE